MVWGEAPRRSCEPSAASATLAVKQLSTTNDEVMRWVAMVFLLSPE
jgi:hypothetical protein